MVVYGFDPGVTTGVAILEDGKFLSGELSEKELWYYLTCLGEGDTLVYEDYSPRPGVRTWQPAPLYAIGAIRYAGWNRTGHQALGLLPSSTKPLAPDSLLRGLGWYKAAMGHANDAARVIVAAALTGLIDLPEIKERVRAFDHSNG